MAKTDNLRSVWWVEHPRYGLAIVQAENWEQATVEAAKWWEVPWGKVAAMCELQKKEDLPRLVCVKCHEIVYGMERGQTMCAKCACIERDRRDSEKANARRFWKEMRPKAAR